MATDLEVDVEVTIVGVTDRVSKRFAEFDSPLVESVVRGWFDHFADARVRSFVPMLVENRSVEALTAMTSSQDLAAAGDTASQ